MPAALGGGMTETLTRSLLLVAAAAGIAGAEPTMTVTSNPVVDAFGILDIQVETRAAPHVGLTAIAGGGAFAWDSHDPVLELGAKASYYPVREFSGFHLAAAINYAQLGVMPAAGMSGTPSLSFVAAYAGYKYLHSSGFTAEGRIGVAYIPDLGDWADSVEPMLSGSLGYSF